MTDGPGRAEFTAAENRIYRAITDGFSGLERRLELLDGRTVKNEVDIAALHARVSNISKEVFRYPQRRHTDQAGQGESWSFAFTKREGGLMALGLVVIYTLLRVFELVGTVAVRVLMAHRP